MRTMCEGKRCHHEDTRCITMHASFHAHDTLAGTNYCHWRAGKGTSTVTSDMEEKECDKCNGSKPNK